METLTLIQPDDWHLHVRDGAAMASCLPYSAARFGRAIIMPNLQPPICTVAEAIAYRDRITDALPAGSTFDPLMTIYLTDDTTEEIIREAAKSSYVFAAKLYPANATTNSALGVTNIRRLEDILRIMETTGLVLEIHGESLVNDNKDVDIFDREKLFIEKQLPWIVDNFPKLKIILEHITTTEAVQFVKNARAGVVATITAHHLLDNRNALFAGGIKPHWYCLPILKREAHRQPLLRAATSGNPKFFIGTDSAPHAKGAKESDCGCAGCFTAFAGIELYAEAFEQMNALDKLEGFTSHYGADFYRLPRNESTITLIKESWEIPNELPFGDSVVVPYRAGETVPWKLVD